MISTTEQHKLLQWENLKHIDYRSMTKSLEKCISIILSHWIWAA